MPLIFEIENLFTLLSGFYLAMGVFHLVIFIFNQKQRANLVYSTGLIIVFINYAFVDYRSTDITFDLTTQKVSMLLNLLTDMFLIFFINYYFFDKTGSWFRYFMRSFWTIYLTGLIALFFIPDFNQPIPQLINIILRTVLYITAITISAYGIVMRIPNFIFIILASILLILTETFVAVDIFQLWQEHTLTRGILLLAGYTIPFIFYSSYLAKDLALTTIHLEKELESNARLSKEKYEQELYTRELLTKQNIELEKIVEERTREISTQRDEIEKQAEEIKEIDKVKSRFFANISHEFRTPLTLLLAPLEKKINQSADENEKQESQLMHRNAQRLMVLVNQLLDLSRLEAGTLKLQATPGDIVAFIKLVLEEFQSLAEIRNITLEWIEQSSITVYFDYEKLRTILFNLLSNSFKFTPAGGKITVNIGIESHSHQVIINIIDTGIGISIEHLPHIFDRFYQVDSTTTRSFEGSGIGLALTKELVELHHGTIKAESELGKGTTFSISLPLGYSHLTSSEITSSPLSINTKIPVHILELPTQEELIHSPQRESILIVEDNDDLRNYLKKELTSFFTVFESADGQQGLEIARREIPSIIISDLMMPHKDGLEMCRELKESLPTCHIPIILLTAKADIESRLQGYKHGADDYISKPFQFEELLTRIQNLQANSKRIQEKYSQLIHFRPTPVEPVSTDDRFIKRVIETVEKNIGNTSFGVEQFAEEMNMSQVQLYRKLRAITKYSPNEFIRDMRLHRAADLINHKAGNIAEVAYQTGFTNLSYFAKVFKDKFGNSPSEYSKVNSGN